MDKISIDIHSPLDQIVDKCEEVLSAQSNIFQRQGELISLQKEDDSISYRPIRAGYARYLLSKLASFEKRIDDTEVMRIHPPASVARCVVERGNYSARYLRAITAFPVVAPDGTIQKEAGYCEQTQTYYKGGVELTVPECPTRQDAINASKVLFDVVCDYPFQSDAHRSAWLSALLAPLVRFTLSNDANIPVNIFSASGPRCGKSSLIKIISHIVNGEDVPVLVHSGNVEEQRKRILGYLRIGRSMVVIDNVLPGEIWGGAAINALLTSRIYEDRTLGQNAIVRYNNDTVWYANGNNIQLTADTPQRANFVRLCSDEESPELRTNFKHNNIIEYVREHRDIFLSAALTIIKAYIDAGKPKQDILPQGSFEEFGNLVRGAIVWCGHTDPAISRGDLDKYSDSERHLMSALTEGLMELTAQIGGEAIDDGVTARQVIDALQNGTEAPILRDALMELTRTKAIPTSHSLGKYLAGARDRNFGGIILRIRRDDKRGHRYKIEPYSEERYTNGHCAA